MNDISIPTRASAMHARYGGEAGSSTAGPWNEVIDCLMRHRSVRAYRPDALPEGTVETMVAAAQSAATSSNMQTWSVVAVTEPAAKAALAVIAGSQAHIEQCPVFLVWVADLSRLERVGTAIGQTLEGLPYLETFLFAALDAAIAAQNAAVAAESMGLATVYIGALRNDVDRVASLLGLPPGAVGVMGLCVGYADESVSDLVKPRLPQSVILHHERYGTAGEASGVAAYDRALEVFSAAAERASYTWTNRVMSRMGRIAALSGRDKLRDALVRLGFPLRSTRLAHRPCNRPECRDNMGEAAMQRYLKRAQAALAVGLVAAMLSVAPGYAAPLNELVSYSSADKIGLNALLWVPAQPTNRIAILVPGFYGNMIGGHDYNPMAQQMANKGFAFMTINMRTNSDFTDPHLQDAIPDITAAVEFAKGRGYTNIVMMGTSLGGPRSMLYMAQNKDPAIKAYVLLAAIMSPYEEAQLRMDAEHKAQNEIVLADARKLVASGHGDGVVVFDDWFKGRAVRMTARGYLNTFGAPQDTDISTPLRGKSITVPVALFHGTKDEISLPPNAEAIYASLTSAPSRELIWVEGATHYLQPGWIAEEYAKRISDWVAKTVPAQQ